MGLIGCPPPQGGTTSGGGSSSSGGSTSGGGGTAAQPRLSNRCAQASFSASEAARKVSTFLRATAAFSNASADLADSLFDVCKSVGRELGMSEAELSGDLRGTCDAVAAKVRSELQAAQSEANLRVDVFAQPPRCEVTLDAYARCAAECDATVTPGELEVNCEGGYVYGRCEAECQGSCAVDVSGQCSGACEGTCQGGCTGVCQGSCEGTCSAYGPDGQCNGSCDGTCYGTCSAGCNGSCEGSCWVEGQASCEGMCRGGCSVDYQEPRCTGHYRAPEVDVDCQASCEARLQADAQCQPGELEVRVTGDVDAAADRVARLRAALSQFRQLAVIREKARHVKEAGEDLVAAARRLRGAGQAGADAVLCLAEAAAVIPNAMASVSVSVEVSVSVSASASVQAQ
ncbi:MAG: hypothetical protein CMN29_19395 [Sandaracinus sp.]|nr:hypothetical protein [Sandaracinus sp.]